MKAPPRATIVLLLVLASAPVSGEVPHVANDAAPRDGIVDCTLEEQWRAGGLDDDENLFGVIAQVLADEAGNLYLLDQQLSEVAVFSPDGERLATLSREGDGPGETRNPNDMFFLPDGNIGLIQVFPGKIIRIDREGNPAGVFPLQSGDPTAGAGFSVLVRGKCRGGDLALVGIDQSFGAGLLEQTYYLRSFSVEGERQAEYAMKTAQQNFADMVLDEEVVDFVWTRWDLAGGGRVVVAPHRNRYLLEIRDAGGDLLRTCARPYEPLPREAADTARATALLEAQGRNYPMMPRVVVSDYEPDLVSLQVLDDDTIWVTTSRGVRAQPEGIMMTFDVFDMDGVFVRQVRVHADGDGQFDLLYLVDGERAVLVKNFLNTFLSSMGAESGDEGAEPMEVLSCRIAY